MKLLKVVRVHCDLSNFMDKITFNCSTLPPLLLPLERGNGMVPK